MRTLTADSWVGELRESPRDFYGKGKTSKALAALTTAALGLPGLKAEAAVPVTQATGNVQYGHYWESDDRMKVEVYHGDFTLPVTDRMEFFFSVDRDTYSGATPSFSLPETMTNQVRYKGSEQKTIDVISAASGGVTASGLTVLGDLWSLQDTRDPIQNALTAKTNALDALRQEAIDQYLVAHPRPPGLSTLPGPITITFDGIANAVYGKANEAPDASGGCGAQACYLEDDMIVGTVSDVFNPSGHIHRSGTPSNRSTQYHGDSSGIYVRHADGRAFSLESLRFDIGAPAEHPTGNYWEILGFNTATNPSLTSGDGTNYPTRVAYQQVQNTHTGILALDSAFRNINAFWIHAHGFIQDVLNASGADFEVKVDDIALNKAENLPQTPEQIAWDADYLAFLNNLATTLASDPNYQQDANAIQKTYKDTVVSILRNVLERQVPPKTRTVQRFQTQPVETRTQPVFGARYYFDQGTLGLSGGQSNEPDFHSTFGGLNYSHELNRKLTTLSAGYHYTHNVITRSGAAHAGHHELDPGHNPAIYPELKENSDFHSVNLGLSQILGKNSLLQLSANYAHQSGYLSNPYKFVYVRGEITPEEYFQLSEASSPGDINWNQITKLEVVGLDLFREVRPSERNLFSLSTRLNQYLPALDAAVHFDYRFYADDWDIHSHTFQLHWFQKLPWGLTITPSLRYYTQTQADFFAPYFLAPRADGYYSSDFRLSDYGALAGGVTVSKQFNRGIRLDLGVEYYTHQGDLKLGGGGESDYADFSYWMTHANLNVDLSAPGQMFGEGDDDGSHHHHHHHHGAPIPAGIMFGHMMPKADDIMVGYRYQFAHQTGDILRATHTVSDRFLAGQDCGGVSCNARPTEMTMHMHMLDLMYAPTDWLNLMVMPQLMDMKMKLRPLEGATAESAHGEGHETHGLGDTLLATLVKVFDVPGHHMHVGLGVSAPTGDVDATLDGRDEKDSELQDYGMQLGSGTWDFKPSLTYTGYHGAWSWGAQLSATKRLETRNDSGYVLGDQFQATTWGSYAFTHWLSASVRGLYTEQGKIRGQFNRAGSQGATVDAPSNYGGTFWDVGFGLHVTVPSGAFAGHSFSVEWLQPVADRFNGYQLEREGSLFATWNYTF